LRKSACLATLVAVIVLCSFASAQQGDAYIGGGTMLSSTPSSADRIGGSNCTLNSSANAICPEKGGFWMNLGGDIIFKRRIGAAFDINWRASDANFGGPAGQPYRPLIFTFNGVYQPRLGKKAGLDLFGGIGWQSTRFYSYQATTNCIYFGACYNSSNHFVVDIGGGLRYYVWGHMFIRPEMRYYNIMNNTDNFTSDHVIHVGASIGYTIGPE
jgi:opacity protein-like surface antigen